MRVNESSIAKAGNICSAGYRREGQMSILAPGVIIMGTTKAAIYNFFFNSHVYLKTFLNIKNV